MEVWVEKENEVGGILIRVSSLNRKYVHLKRSRRKEEGEEDEEAWGQSEYSVTLWLREGNSEYYFKSLEIERQSEVTTGGHPSCNDCHGAVWRRGWQTMTQLDQTLTPAVF